MKEIDKEIDADEKATILQAYREHFRKMGKKKKSINPDTLARFNEVRKWKAIKRGEK